MSRSKFHGAFPEYKWKGSVVSITGTYTIKISLFLKQIVPGKEFCSWSYLNGTISAFEVGMLTLYFLLHIRGYTRKRMDSLNLHFGAEKFPLKSTSSVGLRIRLKKIRVSYFFEQSCKLSTPQEQTASCSWQLLTETALLRVNAFSHAEVDTSSYWAA